MKIVADENMPLVRELFGRHGEIVQLPGRSITSADLGQADLLLVRSVTQVDAQLLAGSLVRFVGTGTIGVDHIDLTFIEQQGIGFAYAPGCNAQAVQQYVFSALASQRPQWRQQTVAIIGCGNVGGAIYRALAGLGVEVVGVDPFLAEQGECGFNLVPLERALQCDIICCHTPYTTYGPHPTHHLLASEQLAALKPGAMLLNAGRGGVIDNRALLALLKQRDDLSVVLDVWEGEPEPDLALLERVAIATPHIAGYSIEGRENGTHMVYRAFCRWAEIDHLPLPPAAESETVKAVSLNELIAQIYDIGADSARTRAALCSSSNLAADFDHLRKTYPQRRDYGHYRVSGSAALLAEAAVLGLQLGNAV